MFDIIFFMGNMTDGWTDGWMNEWIDEWMYHVYSLYQPSIIQRSLHSVFLFCLGNTNEFVENVFCRDSMRASS